MASRPPIRAAWLLALVIGVGSLAWWLALGRPQSAMPDPAQERPDSPSVAQGQQASGSANSSRVAITTKPARVPAVAPNKPACAPTARRACRDGDVYQLDACGQPHRKVEECGASLCRSAACQRGDGDCQGPPEGRCDGDAVVTCVAGASRRIDCAALGKRCFMGTEGAGCRVASALDCDPDGRLPRCEDGVLVTCQDGRRLSIDCRHLDPGASCGQLATGDRPGCLLVESRQQAPRSTPTCGPCGCESDEPGQPDLNERCDGRDNDDDGYVDEDSDCGVVELVPIVVTNAAGNSSYSDADLRAELARVNGVLASAPPGLRLTAALAPPVYLRRPEWLVLDTGELDALLRAPEVLAASADFFVPVFFTDEIIADDTPKLGLATLPNGQCGGRRVEPTPVPSVGGIVVAKARLPTTVAHELGHYLGLCHTHFDYDGALTRIVRWPASDTHDALQRCTPSCRSEGDGICDTARDPGPGQCVYDRACQVRCATGEVPDASNVMSYYSACRVGITAEQARTMRHGLSLRRGYFQCREPGACPCDPLSPTCPEDMTCRPGRSGYLCGLDGPRAPGAPCQHHAECAKGALCASDGVCRRPCHPARDRCACIVDARLNLRVCDD